MKRKIIYLPLAIGLSIILSTSAFAGDIGKVNFDGVNRIFNEYENVDGTIMVDAVTLAEYLGIDYAYTNLYVEFGKDDVKLKLYINSTDGEVITTTTDDNDEEIKTVEKVTAPTPTVIDGSTVLVPLRFVSETFGNTVSWNSEVNAIYIDTDRDYLSELEVSDQITEDTNVYTYDRATKMAISNSQAISDQKKAYDDMREQLEDSTFNLAYAGTYLARTELLAANRQMEYALRQEDDVIKTMELGVELQLMSTLNSIKESNMQRELLEKSIELAQTNLSNTEIKYDLDLASQNDVINAKNSLDDLTRSLNSLEISYENSVRSLNDLLGRNLEDDTVVLYEPTITDFNMTEDQLDKYVIKSAANNPALIALDNNIENAQYRLDLYYTLGAMEKQALGPYEKKKREDAVKDAQKAKKQAREGFEYNLRNYYSTLNLLIENEKTLQAKLDSSIKDYNDLVTNYVAGNITTYQLDQAEMGILSAESDIAKNELDYNTTLFMFNNPNLISTEKLSK